MWRPWSSARARWRTSWAGAVWAGGRGVAVRVGSGELAHKLAAADVAAWQAVDLDGKPSPSDLAAFARGLSRVIERERPDVGWAVGLEGAVMAGPTSSHRHITLVWW